MCTVYTVHHASCAQSIQFTTHHVHSLYSSPRIMCIMYMYIQFTTHHVHVYTVYYSEWAYLHHAWCVCIQYLQWACIHVLSPYTSLTSQEERFQSSPVSSSLTSASRLILRASRISANPCSPAVRGEFAHTCAVIKQHPEGLQVLQLWSV